MGSILPCLAAIVLLVGCVRAGFEPAPAADSTADASDAGNAGAWTPLGGSSSGLGPVGRAVRVTNIRLAQSADGKVHLAWVDDHSGARQVYLVLWDGSQWKDLGGSSSAGGVSASQGASRLGDLALDSQGRPLLTWMEQATAGSVYLRRWSGSAWEELGGSATDRGISGSGNPWWPALVLDSADRPTVAWETYNIVPGGVIHLRRWNGQSWEEVAGSATGRGISGESGSAKFARLAGSGDDLHLGWLQEAGSQTCVAHRRLLGGSWAPMVAGNGCVSPAGEEVIAADLDLDDAMRPVVAWQAKAGERSVIHLAAWDGTGWAGLGGSATGDGLSAGMEVARNPSLVVHGGRVTVAWEAVDALGTNIYARAWIGGTWRELGGSFAAGGISHSTLESTYPHLARAADGLLVAWEEALSDTNVAAHLRLWAP